MLTKGRLGGLLTNFSVIRKSVEKLLDLDEMKRDGRWEVKSKKEQSKLDKIYKKLYKNLWGIRSLDRLPGVLIIIDSNFEDIAVFEGKKLEIPIVGIVDTNADPEGITYPVPGNDDAIRSIKLFVSKFGEAVKEGLEQRLSNSLEREKEESELDSESDEENIETAAVQDEEKNDNVQDEPVEETDEAGEK